MKYERYGCKNHGDKIGVLIAQLGTPEAPTARALKPYLKQFLGDPRVIEKPRWLWWMILNGIILNVRPKRSAALYQRIWTDEGSPLMVYTKLQSELLKKELQKLHTTIEVEFGMRYGQPSLESGLDRLIEAGCSKILLFNMYPQYSATTVATNYDAVFKHLLRRRVVPTLRVVEPYYNNPHYISALSATINEGLKNYEDKMSGRIEKLVLSYHGIPEEYVSNGDVYCCQCTETTLSLVSKLDFPESDVIHTYQSRFGKDPWLEPYSDEVIRGLAEDGVKNIAVACPGFVADCLETLDELGHEAQEEFVELGGKSFTLIPCLNDHPSWIEAMKNIVMSEISSWIETAARSAQNECAVKCPVACAKAKNKSK